MMVLHAIWVDREPEENHVEDPGGLHLWAESSGLPLRVPRRRGRPPKRPRPRQHPFALETEALTRAISGLGGFGGGPGPESAVEEWLTLLLPSTSTGPSPSPEFIPEEYPGDAPVEGVAPWRMAALCFEPKAALELLLSLPDRPGQGWAYGGSLRFWTEAAKLVLELVSRQCLIPTVHKIRKKDSTVFHSAWEMTLGIEETERAIQLGRAMPPVCRAEVSGGGRGPPSPWELLTSFLNRTGDVFIKEKLAATRLLPPRRGRRPRALPLPEQWLQGLIGGEPELKGAPEELATFTAKVRTWLGGVGPGDSQAPFRTCFRLEPPGEEDDDEWRLDFHLQANDDPSLLVSAEKVWQERSRVGVFLTRRFENPQERLLADLGRASRLFPALEESLEVTHPKELRLQAKDAYAFLRQSAPLLEQSGFGVLLPPWWRRPGTRLGVKLALKPKPAPKTGSGLMDLKALVAYDWRIAIGEQTLSKDEFEALARLKVPLVRVKGQWVELRSDEIEKAITFFKRRRGAGEMALQEALRIGLGREESEVGLPVLELEGHGWVEDFLEKVSRTAKISSVRAPRAFHGRLRPYQRRGLAWLVYLQRFGLGACLADDMGLGKTIQLIALLLHERTGRGKKSESRPDPTLLICPMSIVGNWHKEVQRFAPSLKTLVHHGPDRLSGRAFTKEALRHDLVITTYSLTHRDRERFSTVEWERIVLDEAQNIKNPTTKQTRAVKDLEAKFKVAMTGTPVENRLSELWSIMDFLNPGYLGTVRNFHRQFALPIQKYHDAGQAETLKRLVQPYLLRRLKSDKSIIKDLPEKMEMKVFCNLTQEQASLYEAVVKDMMVKIEDSGKGIERKGQVLAALMKLKQVCNHPAQFVGDGSSLPGRSGKLARLEEMLEEALAEGDKALIFTQFAQMGTMLRTRLQEALGCEVLYIYGGTPKRQRDAMIERFQDDRSGPPLFILSLKAGGVGLNLTAANRVFHFDRWWNPAVENQATDRAYRIGQKKNVLVHKFVCVGTLEERIDLMIEQKKELAERIIGGGEGWITQMSTDQLRELFALSREAVAM